MAELQRTTFETSRAAEYFNARELQAQTGQPTERFATVALKELVDNALDAAETRGVQPDITIEADKTYMAISLAIQDNGGGIAPETVKRILNFQTRTSDKAAYRSPTRGAQGNALKTVIGMPHALGSEEPVIIEAQNTRHVIHAWTDPAGELRIDYSIEPSPLDGSSKIALTLPANGQTFYPVGWGQAYALFNPHALVKIRCFDATSKQANNGNSQIENFYQNTVTFPGNWRKFLPTDLTSPYWYDHDALKRLIFAHINQAHAGGEDLTLRDFVGQFKGLSGTAARKAVCDQIAWIKRLSDFERQEFDVAHLLDVMKRQAVPPSPSVLGLVGEDHFRSRFDEWYTAKRFWYKKVSGVIDDIPFVFEVALAETEQRGDFFSGVNFSPTFEDPLSNTRLTAGDVDGYGLLGFLTVAHASPDPLYYEYKQKAQTAAAAHLVCPALEFLDRGKTRLKIANEMAELIAAALWSVSKTLYQEEERRRKDAARQARAQRNYWKEVEKAERARQWSQKEAVFEVLPEALAKATGNGQYPVSSRNLYYQVRPLIQAYTDKELDYNYFSQDLLTQYRDVYGPIRGLYYDPRGVLYEPHSREEIRLGTREVESYSFPVWLYDKILYIEKKGLWPILEQARLAEKYDMALIAAEGYATEATRLLFARAEKNRNYTLLVLHDADPYGYNIARTLQEETRRMPGYKVNVIDLGLHLEEALEMGLQTEEFTRKKALPDGLELSSVERQYFEGRQVGKSAWVCQRVELNAFTAPGLVEFIERRLAEVGATGKVIPPDDELKELAEDLYYEYYLCTLRTEYSQLGANLLHG